MSKMTNFYRFLFIIVFGLFPSLVNAQESCTDDLLDIRSDGTSVRFTIEVVDTPEGRSQGLMNRVSMPRFSGMLFVYPREMPVAFWMRNTLIPLDMLFIDQNGVVKTIHENAIPLDETSIPSDADVKFVLEINGGMASMLKLAPEAVVRHPAIDGDNIAWPCE